MDILRIFDCIINLHDRLDSAMIDDIEELCIQKMPQFDGCCQCCCIDSENQCLFCTPECESYITIQECKIQGWWFIFTEIGAAITPIGNREFYQALCSKMDIFRLYGNVDCKDTE